MQNRYTGDIGDFGKLGLLRRLSEAGLHVGVNWYLVPDESHNDDGRHIGYLEKDGFRACDEALWRALGDIVRSGQRQVSALEREEILPAKFYSRVLDFTGTAKPERAALRGAWHAGALDALRGCDVVFADPDNGLIVPSAEGTGKSNKFVLPGELAGYYKAGATVIYYQHKARRPDGFYAGQHRELLVSGKFPDAAALGLKFRTTSQRYYFFLIQPRHRQAVETCVKDLLASPWGQHFEAVPL